MKSVDELYKKYCNAYKRDYDIDFEKLKMSLKRIKRKSLTTNSLNQTTKYTKLDEKRKELKLIELPKWLSSRNDFNKARKLINNIRADTNRVKSSSGDEKVFNDLNGLINDIQE